MGKLRWIRPSRKQISYEKATILNALKNSQGHKVKTAAALGISRTTLFNKMKKYGIRTSTGT